MTAVCEMAQRAAHEGSCPDLSQLPSPAPAPRFPLVFASDSREARNAQRKAASDTGTSCTSRISAAGGVLSLASPPPSSIPRAHGSLKMSCVPSSSMGTSLTGALLRTGSSDARTAGAIIGRGRGTLDGTCQPRRSCANCFRRKRRPILYVAPKTYRRRKIVGWMTPRI
ncbi:hypothetical protein L227DRAFT_125101 [Lentinus tigrinus ALCF2SS1-6]|uniref:Uncharacterized protein n=1 Tax=Lentinus tigrinus ALCF2SS1-6 TaxID=1328759 RepID=A0A5C2SPW5_9APHY|nr:hypothetical protein L227DRAFT_125101 [Lentinus tigrinus ALCF2SS1-6]